MAGHPAVELRGGLARGVAVGACRVDDHDLGVLAERRAEAQPEVHGHPDHQGHVGLLEALPSRARECKLVVGGHASAPQPVHEHGDPELLGQRAQGILTVSPVEAGAGHDHRTLRAAQQLDGPLGARRGRQGAVVQRVDRRVGVRVGLHEHVVEREVEEGGPAGRTRRRRRRQRPWRPGFSAVESTVAAERVSGAVNGT